MKPTCSTCFCRTFVLSLLAGATLLAGLPAADAQPFAFTNTAPRPLPRRANLILIVTDCLGYGDLSCYGQSQFATPNLDRLAASGVRFTSYYAGDAAASPARAALLLGRDSRHLLQRADMDVPLAADDITVARVLKQSGYHTGLIGEWELGGDGTSGAPWQQGFDEFAGYLDDAGAENYYADYMWRHAPAIHFTGREVLYPNTGGKQGQYIPDLYTKAMLQFIKNNLPDPFNHYRPFFLLMDYATPRANTAEAARTGNGLQVPTDAPYSDEPWPQAEKNRAAMIARLDADIGRLLDLLKSARQESNTVIFFTSNAGPQTNGGVDPKFFQSAGPLRGVSGGPYEGGRRVPMIVSWPGRIPAGRVSDFAWAAWDFLPTAADIALIQPPAGIDGISVWPTLLGENQTNRHDVFYWQLRGQDTWRVVRKGDWEAVQPKAGAPLELYNLKSDPGETKDVADKNPGVVAQFKKLLQDQMPGN